MGQIPADGNSVAMQNAKQWNAQHPIVPDENGNYAPRTYDPSVAIPQNTAQANAKKWNAAHPIKKDLYGNYPIQSGLYGK